MYKYPLSSKHKQITNQWLSVKDKPLIITGDIGCGKTSLAKQLVKNYYSIEITVEHLKYSGDLIQFIKSGLFKKDIMMMCSKNHYKSLVIDDFNVFLKHDKQNASKLLTFITSILGQTINYPIIIILDTLNYKLIKSFKDKCYLIELKVPNKLYKKLSIKNNKSNNLYDIHKQGLTSIEDKIYTHDQLLLNVCNDIELRDIFRLASCEYNTLSLNYLENYPNIINNYKYIYDSYKSVCIGDYYESKLIDKNSNLDILIYFICVYPLVLNKRYTVVSKNYKIKYNTYISKSLIQIHNQSILTEFNYIKLLMLIYTNQYDNKSKEISELLSNRLFDKKTLDKQIKVYNYYFNKLLTKTIINKTLKNIKSM